MPRFSVLKYIMRTSHFRSFGLSVVMAVVGISDVVDMMPVLFDNRVDHVPVVQPSQQPIPHSREAHSMASFSDSSHQLHSVYREIGPFDMYRNIADETQGVETTEMWPIESLEPTPYLMESGWPFPSPTSLDAGASHEAEDSLAEQTAEVADLDGSQPSSSIFADARLVFLIVAVCLITQCLLATAVHILAVRSSNDAIRAELKRVREQNTRQFVYESAN